MPRDVPHHGGDRGPDLAPPSPFAAALASAPGPFASSPFAPSPFAPAPTLAPAAYAPALASPPSFARPRRSPAPPPALAPAPPRFDAPPRREEPAPGARPPLEELERFRDELDRAAADFMAAYDRVLGALRTATDAALRPAEPGVAAARTGRARPPRPARRPGPRAVGPAVRVLGGAEPVAAARGTAGLDATLLHGTITVDAGPFTDIATLTSFEQAMRAVTGVREVQVRGFEGSCAFIDVVLDRPVALGQELRRTAPVPFTLTQAGPRRLSIAVEPRDF